MIRTRPARPGRRPRLVLLVSGLLLSTALAACGGDADSSGGPAPTTSTPSDLEPTSASPTQVAAAPPPDDKPFGPQCGVLERRRAELGAPLSTVPLKFFMLDGYSFRFHAGVLSRTGLIRRRGVTFLVPVTRAYRILPTETHVKLFRRDFLEDLASRHVLEGRLPPSRLGGDHRTLAGGTVSISVSGDEATVGGQGAGVLCGNIRLAGVTVYLIDAVLLS